MNEEYGGFDPANFSVGGFLDGKEGRIDEAVFTKYDYNETVNPPANTLKLVISRLDSEGEVDGERTEYYGLGAHVPSPDGNFFIGELSGGCKTSDFIKALILTAFPIRELNEKGAVSFVGKTFLWKVIAKAGAKDFSVPAEYVGADEGESTEPSAVTAKVIDVIFEAVTDAGELPKSKLSAIVGQKFNGRPDKVEALQLVTKDSFLRGLKGIEYKNGVLSV